MPLITVSYACAHVARTSLSKTGRLCRAMPSGLSKASTLPPGPRARLDAALAVCRPQDAASIEKLWINRFEQKRDAANPGCILEALIHVFPERLRPLCRFLFTLTFALWAGYVIRLGMLSISAGPPSVTNPIAVFETSIGKFEAEVFADMMVSYSGSSSRRSC